MKKALLLLAMTFLFAAGYSQGDCDELFFSEYVEGTENSKALEIYNPTNEIVDLSKYWIVRYSNGSSTYTSGGYTQLEGFLLPHDVFVFVNGQTEDNQFSTKCDPALQALADMLDGDYPAPTYMNGNDAIALLKDDDGDKDLSNAVAVDLIGEIGLGDNIKEETGWSYVKDSTLTYRYRDSIDLTGQVINYIVQAADNSGDNFGPFWMAWTKDHTLIRKASITKGVTTNPSPFVVSMEWDTLSNEPNEWDSLGIHNSVCNNMSSIRKPGDHISFAKVFPNPSIDGVINLQSSKEMQSVEIYSILGQVILKKEFHNLSNAELLDLSDKIKGPYLIKISFRDNSREIIKLWLQ